MDGATFQWSRTSLRTEALRMSWMAGRSSQGARTLGLLPSGIFRWHMG